MIQIPIINAYDEATPYTLDLTIDGDAVRIQVDGAFAGRDVDEELPVADLQALLAADELTNDDLLGFILRSEGDRIHGLIGVGSGNERFSVRKADFPPLP